MKDETLKKSVKIRFLENIMSVKVWMYLISLFVLGFFGAWIIYNDFELVFRVLKSDLQPDSYVYIVEMSRVIKDTFLGLCMSITSLVGTIVVVRETFKVGKLRALNNEKTDNSETIKRMDI